MVLVFRVIPYHRNTRYFPMLVFRVIPYYCITRYFPITVLISRAGSELFGGWGVMILWRSQPLQSQTAFLRSIAEIAQPG